MYPQQKKTENHQHDKQIAQMNRIRQALVWLRRIAYCRGFGIQSPTDYRFVRYVINEHWPYYAYDTLRVNDNWLRKKLGRLYFRIANELQPKTAVDLVGAKDCLLAACKKIVVADRTSTPPQQPIELALVPIQSEYQTLFMLCDAHSVVVFENIYQHYSLWHCIENDPRATITFDLYYCGIVFFDSTRTPHHYKINF